MDKHHVWDIDLDTTNVPHIKYSCIRNKTTINEISLSPISFYVLHHVVEKFDLEQIYDNFDTYLDYTRSGYSLTENRIPTLISSS